MNSRQVFIRAFVNGRFEPLEREELVYECGVCKDCLYAIFWASRLDVACSGMATIPSLSSHFTPGFP